MHRQQSLSCVQLSMTSNTYNPTKSSHCSSLVPQLRQAHKGGVEGAVVAHHLHT